MNISKKVAVVFGVIGLAAGTVGSIALQTHAASTTTTTAATTTPPSNGHWRGGTPPAAAGSVTAVSGNTITVTDKKSGASFTVDASSATIEKMPTAPVSGSAAPAVRPTPTTISVSGIAVGDNVMVQGTVSGTNITATKIVDGMMMGGRRGFGGPGGHGKMGTVSSVSGNTITLTGKDGATYTVDASGASVKKVSSNSVSGIAAGDTLMVDGTTSGTTITAKNIVDGDLGNPGQPATTTSPPAAQ